MTLEVNQLNFSVNDKALLQGVNLHIDEPKIIGIIGPNGAGKSTLLKCLSGLLPTNDMVYLNGRSLTAYQLNELAQIRAALPQESHLTFPFPAKDVVGMSFALSKLSNAEQHHLIQQCLKKFSALDLAERNFTSLSGGEKQRIHLARVIAQLIQHLPNDSMRYLMLDEPTAPLDLKHQFQLFEELRRLKYNCICSIVVIHDINLAAHYCDEIWVLYEGKLVKKASPQEAISERMMQEVFEVSVKINCFNESSIPSISIC